MEDESGGLGCEVARPFTEVDAFLAHCHNLEQLAACHIRDYEEAPSGCNDDDFDEDSSVYSGDDESFFHYSEEYFHKTEVAEGDSIVVRPLKSRKFKDYFDGKIFYPNFLENIVDRRFVSQAISQVGIDGHLSALLTDEEYEKLKGMKEVDTICRMQHFMELLFINVFASKLLHLDN